MTLERSKEKMGRYIYHFYSPAVESGFYSDTGRVTAFFTKLSNRDRG